MATQSEENQPTLVEIRSTGDILLDVHFKNTSECTKSIPKDALRSLRTRKLPIPSPRILYRVRLDTLKKHSEYFRIMLKPQFAEGLAVEKALKDLADASQVASELEPEKLPRVSIIDEDTATKTFGREAVFRDMLRIIHGADPITSPITTQFLTVLVLMADHYNVTSTVSRHMQKVLVAHKYPITLDKNGEEILRQRVLIQFHTDQGIRFANSTKDLILKGSTRWTGMEDLRTHEYQASWWDLPSGLEAELTYRRTCVLRTIASIQTQYLIIYSSKERQCKLGYDSSASCDSFQLGEMVKFLTRKGLLSLVPFQAVSPEDPEYIWPEAYSGDIEYLIGVLRQCPSYQIDHNHGHCGLRTRLLPALDYIKSCIDTGLGIKLNRSKTGPAFESWIPSTSVPRKKSFWVSGKDGEDVDVGGYKAKEFEFVPSRSKTTLGGGGRSVERTPKGLFTAEKWNWVNEPETPMMRTGPTLDLGRR
ncbi:uncharacterized protein LY89DRAFT_681223 [Mollisia scopiformis]|uniref:Hydroxyproline-rich glyco protein n=1 Tax=Mollisia scopiformis TaxID=149040 RepID=A0A194XNK4_MOLSC|nr:uncharacterized protein LY89DRAFT_681223 [Mollisia scopiformis]KUJ21830.1 hypothetical protein LY89DRAFT_681223 [Mollisia scopiformis]